jgi:hypothetical protein
VVVKQGIERALIGGTRRTGGRGKAAARAAERCARAGVDRPKPLVKLTLLHPLSALMARYNNTGAPQCGIFATMGASAFAPPVKLPRCRAHPRALGMAQMRAARNRKA